MLRYLSDIHTKKLLSTYNYLFLFFFQENYDCLEHIVSKFHFQILSRISQVSSSRKVPKAMDIYLYLSVISRIFVSFRCKSNIILLQKVLSSDR